MEIIKLTYNFVQSGDFKSGIGEDYECAEIGEVDTKRGIEVVSIEEHYAQGEGDKWYYEIFYIDNISLRIFNPNTVYRKKN